MLSKHLISVINDFVSDKSESVLAKIETSKPEKQECSDLVLEFISEIFDQLLAQITQEMRAALLNKFA